MSNLRMSAGTRVIGRLLRVPALARLAGRRRVVRDGRVLNRHGFGLERRQMEWFRSQLHAWRRGVSAERQFKLHAGESEFR